MNGKLTAIAQIILSIMFVGGYFWVLSQFILGEIIINQEWKDTLTSLLSLLAASVLQIFNFWFSRTRETTEREHNKEELS